MIASLKGYSRVARTLLAIVACLLAVGVVVSILMSIRAEDTAIDRSVDQAERITDNSLSLAFVPGDVDGPVGSQRAAQLSDEMRAIVLDPSEFTDVTLLDTEGTILYSTKLSLIGSDLPGEQARIREALRGIPQTADVDGVFSVMLPLRFASGLGDPAAVVLERSDDEIVQAATPWRTNAMFLFAMLVLLGVAVFGVARVLSVATSEERMAARAQMAAPAPARQPVPQPGLREEGEARRRAEERARAAEERLTLLQEQYKKAIDDLQTLQRMASEAPRTPDPRLEERALRAEGQLTTLQQQLQTLTTERERLAAEVNDLSKADRGGDPLAELRLREAEREATGLRAELEGTSVELSITKRELDRMRSEAGRGTESNAQLEAAHQELQQTRDALRAAQQQAVDAARELDGARTEMRALRNEEQRAAMLDDELRSLRAELDSVRASQRAELVEREADLEEKVRSTREEFQRQLASIEESYRGQIGQKEADLASRIANAEAAAAAAARELESTTMAMQAARAEAEGREQRLIEAAGEMTDLRTRIGELEAEMKERSLAITHSHKETDDLRRSLVGLQADLQRADASVSTLSAQLEAERARNQDAESTAAAVTRERSALTERVDKLARMLEAAAAENADLNRRLQDAEARRQLELADDEGRAQLDDLLRVTQERLAGQTEKLIAAEDRVRDLETELTGSSERLEIIEAELRTHQMSEALREMRTPDVHEAPRVESPATALEDRRASTPFMQELSHDAKTSLARINGIAQLLKHQKGAKEQAQLLKQLGTFAKRLDATVTDLSEADNLVHGTVELAPRRSDLEALVTRVVEESEIAADRDVKVVAESTSLTIDPHRTQQTLAGLLRGAGERTSTGKSIVVRLRHVEGGALLSVEDPEPASDAAMSPVVRRLAEIQGGWAKVEGRDGGGSAFTVFLPDLSEGIPAPTAVATPVDEPVDESPIDEPIVVEEATPAVDEPTPEQILSRELRRLAEAESNAPAASSGRRKRR